MVVAVPGPDLLTVVGLGLDIGVEVMGWVGGVGLSWGG